MADPITTLPVPTKTIMELLEADPEFAGEDWVEVINDDHSRRRAMARKHDTVLTGKPIAPSPDPEAFENEITTAEWVRDYIDSLDLDDDNELPIPTDLNLIGRTTVDKGSGRVVIKVIVNFTAPVEAADHPGWSYAFRWKEGVDDPDWKSKHIDGGHGVIDDATSGVEYIVQARTIGKNRKSDWTDAESIVPLKKLLTPPRPAGLTAKEGHKGNDLEWEPAIKTDPDFTDYASTIIYRAEVNDFSEAVEVKRKHASHTHDGGLDNDKDYWYWITHLDTSKNESPKYPAGNTDGVKARPKKIKDDDTDDEPPGKPTNLVLTPRTEINDDGRLKLDLVVTFDLPTAGLSAKGSFVLWIKENGTDDVDTRELDRNERSVKLRVRSTRTYTVKVKARNGVGTPGDWCDSVVITIDKKADYNTGVPTGLSAYAGHKANYLTWPELTGVDELDYAKTVVMRATSNDFSAAVEVGRIAGTTFRDANLNNRQDYWYWIYNKDTSKNASPRFPLGPATNNGVKATTISIDDDDIEDSQAGAPTALNLTKIQVKDDDGTIRTKIQMECTPPYWSNGRTTYEFEMTVDGVIEIIPSGDTTRRFLVQKTGVLHSVRVRGVRGIGTPGEWSAAATITPTKKSADASAVTGIGSHKKNGNTVVKWDASNDPDNREFIVKRATSNSYGAATEIGRAKGNRFIDPEVATQGQAYYYFVDPVDTSGNIGTTSASTTQTQTGIGTSDTDASLLAAPTSLSLVQANRDVNRDGSVDTSLLATISGLVANAAGYEIWYEDTAGQTLTQRADSGYFWFIANTTRSYRVRWRTINWVGNPGPWSSFTSYVTPAALGTTPAAPTGVFASVGYLSVFVSFNLPTDADYLCSEVMITNGGSGFTLGKTVTGDTRFYVADALSAGYYVRVRHYRRSHSTPSAWTDSATLPAVPGLSGAEIGANAISKTQLVAGAAAETSKANLGTSGTGSTAVAAGCTSVMSVATFRGTSTTAGVTITLEGDSWTIDLEPNKMYTFVGRRTGGGNVNLSKSGGGTIAGCVLVATGVY